MQAVPHCAQPGKSRAGIFRTERRIGDQAAGIGQKQFFRKSHNKPAHAPGTALGGESPIGDLKIDVMVFDDGTGNKLRKKRNIQKKIHNIFLHLGIAPVHVHHVREDLERIEGDTDGQGDGGHRHRHPGNQIHRVGGQCRIFEHTQHQKIEHHGGGQDPFTVGTVHKTGKDVVYQYGKQQQDHIYRFAEGVEKYADGGQQSVLYPQRGGHKIQQKDRGQKQKQKGCTGKRHTISPISVK